MLQTTFKILVQKAVENREISQSQVRIILERYGYKTIREVPYHMTKKLKEDIDERISLNEESELEYPFYAPKSSSTKISLSLDDDDEKNTDEKNFEPRPYSLIHSGPSHCFRSEVGKGDSLVYIIPAGILGSVSTFHVIESDFSGNVKLIKFQTAEALEDAYGISYFNSDGRIKPQPMHNTDLNRAGSSKTEA